MVELVWELSKERVEERRRKGGLLRLRALLLLRACWLEAYKDLGSLCLWVCWSFGSEGEGKERERERRRKERRGPGRRGRSRIVDYRRACRGRGRRTSWESESESGGKKGGKEEKERAKEKKMEV